MAETMDDFVNQHIRLDISDLMENIIGRGLAPTQALGEALLALEYRVDWLAAARADVAKRFEDKEPFVVRDWLTSRGLLEEDEVEDENENWIGESEKELADMICSDRERAEKYFNERAVLTTDDFESPIQQYWAVSDGLASALNDRGEAVVFEWQGINIWGRTQGDIHLDKDEILIDIHDNDLIG